MENLNAEIITIGNEILSGRTVNTNASYIARYLTFLGYYVKRIIVVEDSLEEISSAFKESISRGIDLIISTGGLGPTYDDMTIEGLSISLGRELEVNMEALEMIREKYRKLNVELTNERIKMAKMPKGAIAIRNDVGTAPGVLVREGKSVIISLPGVPKEMEDMLPKALEIVMNLFPEKKPRYKYMESSFLLRNVMESSLAPLIKEFMKKYKEVYIKSHPRSKELDKPEIEVQISLRGEQDLNEKMRKIIEEIKKEIKRHFAGAEISDNMN